MLFLIIGLGNPGDKYEATRHNVGFRVIDCLAQRFDISLSSRRYSAHSGQGQIKEHQVLLLKPMTFMNLSGKSVWAAQNSLEMETSQIAVIHDDVDLALGRIQVRRGGGHGGHRGLKSIISLLEDRDFVRFRVGVDRPSSDIEISDYVLEKFDDSEQEAVMNIITKTANAIEVWLEKGLTSAMNRFNPWPLADKDELGEI
jgi:PTH1 family peptidyl-tRNA hydrolase